MIFPTTIISGPEEKTLLELEKICKKLDSPLNVNNPDHFHIDENSGWSIKEVRTITTFLSRKPNKHKNKIVIIKEAQNLGTEAQNALLKSLEEPGKDNFFIILTNNHLSLLPTIISRAKLIKLKTEKSPLDSKDLIIPPKDALRALQIIADLNLSKDEIQPFLEKQLQLHQKNLLKDPAGDSLHYIKNILKSLEMIKANVDPFSALDWFFLA